MAPGARDFRFLVDDEDEPGDCSSPSVALRFLFIDGVLDPATGLPARLVVGLVARLPAWPLPNGLVARLAPFTFVLGGLGLVARFASSASPP